MSRYFFGLPIYHNSLKLLVKMFYLSESMACASYLICVLYSMMHSFYIATNFVLVPFSEK